MMSDHFRKLENMYHAAPVNDFYKPKLTVSRGRAELVMDVNPDFFHAANALHGSVYFNALDDAAFFSVNSLVKDKFVVTVSFNIFLLRPITEGALRAEGYVTSRSKTLFIAESVLYLDKSRQAARGSGSFMRSGIQLSEVESYTHNHTAR